MSAAKEAAAVKHSGGETETPSVVVVKKPLTAKRLLVRIVFILVVIALVVGIVYLLVSHHKTTTSSQKVNSAVNAEKATADAHATVKDNEVALKQLQSVSDLAKTTSQKVALYSALAQAYGANGNPQKSIYYYQLKDQLDPSAAGMDAESEADTYIVLGEKSQAIAAFKRNIAYIQQDSQMSAASKNMQIENDNGIIQSLETNQ